MSTDYSFYISQGLCDVIQSADSIKRNRLLDSIIEQVEVELGSSITESFVADKVDIELPGAVSAIRGKLFFMLEEALPVNVIELRQGGRTIARIVNAAFDTDEEGAKNGD